MMNRRKLLGGFIASVTALFAGKAVATSELMTSTVEEKVDWQARAIAAERESDLKLECIRGLSDVLYAVGHELGEGQIENKERMHQAVQDRLALARHDGAVEAVGWTYAGACTDLDFGNDPRKREVPDLLRWAQNDLSLPNKETVNEWRRKYNAYDSSF